MHKTTNHRYLNGDCDTGKEWRNAGCHRHSKDKIERSDYAIAPCCDAHDRAALRFSRRDESALFAGISVVRSHRRFDVNIERSTARFCGAACRASRELDIPLTAASGAEVQTMQRWRASTRDRIWILRQAPSVHDEHSSPMLICVVTSTRVVEGDAGKDHRSALCPSQWMAWAPIRACPSIVAAQDHDHVTATPWSLASLHIDSDR